jgi:hypothetical protein
LECGSEAVTERPERTAQGYRRFRCRACGKQFNERSDTLLNRTQYPSDVIALVVLWRLRYKLSLRDLPEMFAVRGIVFSYEAVREWEAKLVWGFVWGLYGACCVKLYVIVAFPGWMRDDLRGARDRAPSSRRNLVFGRSARDLDHDARMRIGSEAPWRRTHSHPRLKGHCLGRDTTTSDRPRQPALMGAGSE